LVKEEKMRKKRQRRDEEKWLNKKICHFITFFYIHFVGRIR